jgi:crotonobetainyl-CoA:carnitine CoA-transferase CaiB-like acyl-CoA transferase
VSAKNILDDVRVVELSEALAGPYCAMLLGDFGADIVKIERPGVGDQSRGWDRRSWGASRRIFLERTGTSDRLH